MVIDPEDCTNNIDDDGDLEVDCNDSDCASLSVCAGNCGDNLINASEECDGALLNGSSCVSEGFDGGTLACIASGQTYECTFDTSQCFNIVCGDGVVSAGEVCDDQNRNNGDGCDENCQAEDCGNGLLQPGEGCDDGNTTDGDGCNSNCGAEAGFDCSGEPTVCVSVCGDGFVRLAEQCDDQNMVDDDGCDINCTFTACGNGILAGAEECEDGNTVNGDGCSFLCTVESASCSEARLASLGSNLGDTSGGANLIVGCGSTGSENIFNFVPAITGNLQIDLSSGGDFDMVLYARSNCDDVASELDCSDGPLASDDEGLLINVTAGVPITIFVDGYRPEDEGPYTLTLSICGDTVLNSPEQCDDGNITDGDDCDASCRVEVCGNGFVQAGEGCDDGNTMEGDGCNSNCGREAGFDCRGEPTVCVSVCGDGFVTGTEPCDDQNEVNGDGCDNNCTLSACGNSILAEEEECDDGNTIPGDGCESDCSLACGSRLGGSAALIDNASGHCLLRFDAAETWVIAEAKCEALFGTLVVVSSAQENDLLSTLAGGNAIWLGFNDIATEGTFSWVNGEPVTFTNFSTQEPNNFNGVEDCVDTSGTQWNDIPCGDTRRYVCEIP